MTLWQLFITSFKLGFTSFGGPSAHLGFFQQTYVEKQRWIKNENFAQLVALAQFLPGPASSQVGIGIGYNKAKLAGSIVSFLGFTAPSALFLMGFAYWMNTSPSTNFSWIQGLKLVSIVIVFHAVLTMTKSIIKSKLQYGILITATILILSIPLSYIHLYVLLTTVIIGLFIKNDLTKKEISIPFLHISKKAGSIYLLLFFLLFMLLPFATLVTNNAYIQLIDSFYRAGALVFGGGHVVLPLLQTEFVDKGLIDDSIFLAGYGMTQAMPGPLFTFATFIGTAMYGVIGGLVATLAIFLPGFLLILGAFPFWQWCMNNEKLQTSIQLMNAAVIGLLAATWIDPIIITTVSSLKDVAFITILGFAYFKFKVSPTVLVLMSLIIGITFY